jgi:Fe-S oxidoreductase
MAGVNIVDAIIKGRQLVLEQGIIPVKPQQNALESLQLRGNPYGKQPSKRTNWAKGEMAKKIYDNDGNIDTLLYVGCTASYDERVQNIPKIITKIFHDCNISFAFLKDEKCSGEPARSMGEAELFKLLANENMEKFISLGIKKLIVISPHDFHCFKNEYPDEINSIQILHYLQVLEELLENDKIEYISKFLKKVAYHDPCYLGKHAKFYEAPRKILKSIPGLELIEMENIREESLCCGGGGGRMWADIDEEKHLSEIRVQQALNSGAQILATACPYCLINFEDAVKTKNIENMLRVMDVSEIMYESISGCTTKNLKFA